MSMDLTPGTGRRARTARFTQAALHEPVDYTDVRDYETRNGLRPSGGRAHWLGVVFVTLLGAFAALIFAMPIALVLALMGFPGDDPFPAAYLIAAALIGAFAWYAVKSSRVTGVARYRVSRFAAENGFEFVPRLPDPESPGLIFTLGSDRVASEIVRLTEPRPVEIANYRYVEKTSKTHVTFDWSYLEFRLNRPLPHIVLDGVRNNTKLLGSNLPVALATAQRLSLEGDFDRHFTLYCPKGYETDALYLFTPDLMARFIDAGADLSLDVEIVDDRLYVYASGGRKLSSSEPAMWEWVFATIDALNAKLSRWERWRDERLAEAGTTDSTSPTSPTGAVSAATAAPLAPIPSGIAREGRRLKQRIPLLAFVPIVVMVGIWFVIPWLESLTNG